MVSFDSDEFLLQNLADLIITGLNEKCELTDDEYERYVEKLKTHFFIEKDVFKTRFVNGYQLLS